MNLGENHRRIEMKERKFVKAVAKAHGLEDPGPFAYNPHTGDVEFSFEVDPAIVEQVLEDLDNDPLWGETETNTRLVELIDKDKRTGSEEAELEQLQREWIKGQITNGR